MAFIHVITLQNAERTATANGLDGHFGPGLCVAMRRKSAVINPRITRLVA